MGCDGTRVAFTSLTLLFVHLCPGHSPAFESAYFGTEAHAWESDNKLALNELPIALSGVHTLFLECMRHIQMKLSA